jgi:hypothetical protein
MPGPSSPFAARWRRQVLRGFVTACIAIFVAGAVAFAYWRTIGSGSASAVTGTLGSPTIQALTGGDAPVTALLPGGTSDVVLRVNNPNAYSLTITGIAQNGTITASGSLGTCTTTGVTTTFPSSPSIAVASGSHLIDLSAAAAMSTAPQNGCQGATFAIPVSVTFTK